jgi:hypothetical protein
MKERKSAQIVTRVTPQDREWLDREADRAGLDVSAFIRMTLRRERVAREAATINQMAAA